MIKDISALTMYYLAGISLREIDIIFIFFIKQDTTFCLSSLMQSFVGGIIFMSCHARENGTILTFCKLGGKEIKYKELFRLKNQ